MKLKSNPWVITGLVLVALLVASFIGVSAYKTRTDHIIELAEANFKKFEVVFEELVKSRYKAMGLGADVLLLDHELIHAFEARDRKKTAEELDDFYESVRKRHDLTQVNLYVPPATLFYRAHHPELAQMDMSKVRHSVVEVSKNQQRLMVVETGQGGVVGIRALVPVFKEQEFQGTIEFVTSFHYPLEEAADRSEMGWAFGITEAVWKNVERPNDDKTDIKKGGDVYFDYSDSATQKIIKAADFDPRASEFIITEAGDKTVFIHSLKVPSFNGEPVVTVAVVGDVTAKFASAMIEACIRFALALVVLSSLLVLGYVKLDAIRAGMMGSFGAQRQMMETQIALGELAIQKVKDFETVKRRFFAQLMSSISEPLLAITGQLKTATRVLGDGDVEAPRQNLVFALKESENLMRLVADYEQIEVFRQGLAKSNNPLMSVAASMERMQADVSLYQRFPQFHVRTQTQPDLPATRGEPALVEKALSNLVAYAAHLSGQGEVMLTLSQDSDKWLLISLSGSAFAGANAPTEKLLDETRQFLEKMAAGLSYEGGNKILIGLVLARLIFENFGGSLGVSGSDSPGFIVRLPAAI
jgi:signal transduction histidine kinase